MSFDAPATNLLFKNTNNYEYALWSDIDRELALYYGAATSSSAFFPNRISVVVAPDGQWVLHYPTVDVSTHPTDVLADMTALIAANPQ